jgi:hypothetical protein
MEAEMDSNALLLSFLFGMFGMGWFMYGRKAELWVPRAAGLGLMIIPFCIPNLIAQTIVCVIMTVAPFFVREA